MAEAVVSVALETLRTLLQEEVKFLSGVSNEVKGLETQLKEMKCLLEDADRRRHESKTISNWISQIRDLAYRSEDVIETYAIQVSSHKGFRKLLRVLSCGGFKRIYEIASEITDIKLEISRVYNSMHEYGIRSIIQGESMNSAEDDENQRLKRQTYPFERDDCFVGMEDDLQKLVSLVLDDKVQNRVISVWGMGGIGKTTIARKVYNHDEINSCFESFAWVCITQQCRIRSVLEDVLKQLVPHKRDGIMNLSYAEMVEQLCEVQREKRCLVVLDDIWKMEHWDCLKDVFEGEGLKSKILLTTRNQNVADVGFSFKLGLFNVRDGWELLKRKAFPRNHVPDFGPEKELFEELGTKMVQKCGYLPLVISLLGGILSKKKSLDEWELVNKNIDTYLFNAGSMEDNKIHEIVLDLSYEDLPSYLKPCFLYMGQFGEDQYIYGDNLYMLWIAEGLISLENRRNNETLMDVAELYLSELASRCIVQVVIDDAISSKKYISCHLHDVVRELCLSKGKDEDFRLNVVDCQGEKMDVLDPSILGTNTRHLTVHFRGKANLEQDDQRTHDQKHVRSLKFLNHVSRKKIYFPDDVLDFRRIKLVRVLVFEGCNFERRRIPSEIGNLIHLRYLRLRDCELDELPSSINNLIYLFALDLFHSCDVKVPNVLNKMPRLRHLFLPDYRNNNLRNYELKLEGLNELETLVGFNSLVHDLKFVSEMKNLERLQATIHDNKTLSKIINDINIKWNNLRESALIIKQGCDLTSTREGQDILNKIVTCLNLHSLWIDINIKNFSRICHDRDTIFPRIILLTLRNCEIEDDPMEILENLPCLESLCLWPNSYVGQEIKCSAMGFHQLKTLELRGLPNLREWIVERGAMSNLCELEISDCPKLDKVPEVLRFISSLEELELSEDCGGGKRVSAKKRGFQQCLPCAFRHHL